MTCKLNDIDYLVLCTVQHIIIINHILCSTDLFSKQCTLLTVYSNYMYHSLFHKLGINK